MKPDKEPQFISRRQFLTATAAAVGGLTLAACGASRTSGGAATTTPATGPAATAASAAATVAPAPAGAAGQTKIDAWFWDDSFRPVVNTFNKKQDKIRVNFAKVGYDDTHKRLLTSLAAGTGAPDTCAIEIGYVATFTGKGGLVDLLQPPYDAGQYKNDLVAFQWAQGSSPEGRLVCMPWAIGPSGLMYREDLFSQAGLETDPEKLQARIKTWDDWFQLGEDLKKKRPNMALVADAFTDIFTPLVEQQGHGWFTKAGELDYQKALKPLQRSVEARKRGVDAKIDWWGAEWNTGLKKNAFAALMGPCWMQGSLNTNAPEFNGKWRAIHAPEGDYNVGGSFWSIPQQGKHKEAAWEFLKFACVTAEGGNLNFTSQGALPAYRPAWKDPLYEQPIAFYGGQKAYRLWAEIGDKVPPLPVNPNDREANDIISNEITKVKKQGKDPAKAVEDATAEAKRRIRGLKS